MTIAQILDALSEKHLPGEMMELRDYESTQHGVDKERNAFVEQQLVRTANHGH